MGQWLLYVITINSRLVNLQRTLSRNLLVENCYYFAVLRSILEAVAISEDSPRYSAITRRDMKCSCVGLRSCTIKRDKSIFVLLGLMTPFCALLSRVKPDTLNHDAMEFRLNVKLAVKTSSATTLRG